MPRPGPHRSGRGGHRASGCRDRDGAFSRRRSGRYTPARSRGRAGRPSGAGHRAGSRDAGRRSRPSYKERRVSLAPPLRLRRRVLHHIVLDELQKNIGHVLALSSGCRLKGVVQFDRNVQVHSLHFLWFGLLDRSHLLPSEVSISCYEYGLPGKLPGPPWSSSPGLPAEHGQRSHPAPVHFECLSHGHQLLPGTRNLAGFNDLPLRSRHAGPPGSLLDGMAELLAHALDQHAEELAPDLALEGGVAGTRERGGKQTTHILITPGRPPCQAGRPWIVLLL